MEPASPPAESERSQSSGSSALRWLLGAVLIYLLITAVGLISTGFKSATGEQAAALFTVATNPFLGLIVGIVATALIQSSSTVTSIIVGLVAGGLPVAAAVPMVMGANIGTTITNTLVSLGHVNDRDSFRQAFAAATVHDLFNLLCVLVFLPLELLFHPLAQGAGWLSGFWVGSGAISDFNLIATITAPAITLCQSITHRLSVPFDGISLILIGMGLIVFTLTQMSQQLKVLMTERARTMLQKAMGRGPMAGILTGASITVLVQSSSTTTSLVIPLAGAGVLELAQIYPFTLGANIGTCVTALLAATTITGPEAAPALQIAMVHLLYNLSGVGVIYGVPWLRSLPIQGATYLAAVAAERPSLAFAYIVSVFFGVPAICLGIGAFI